MEETKNAPVQQDAALMATTQPKAVSAWTDGKAYNRIAQMAENLAKSDLVPQNYHNNPGNCFLAINFANKLGMEPLTVRQMLAGDQVYIIRLQCFGKQHFIGAKRDGVFLHILGTDIHGLPEGDPQPFALTDRIPDCSLVPS